MLTIDQTRFLKQRTRKPRLFVTVVLLLCLSLSSPTPLLLLSRNYLRQYSLVASWRKIPDTSPGINFNYP
jgi:hypothetical protein